MRTPKQCRERTTSASLSERINIGSIRAITMAVFAIFMLSQGSHTLSFCFGPTIRSRQAIMLRSNTSTTTGRQTLNRRRRLGPRPSEGPAPDHHLDRRPTGIAFDNGVLIARSPVSTGTPGHPTPLGVFSVISKQRWHRSNIYSAAPMPYMQRITWSGIALHAGVVPAHPASHGCIRLKNDFAIRLWHLTKRGTRVIITQKDVQPVEITNPHLFKPKVASDLPEFQTATVAGESIGTAAATHGSLVSNAETPEATSLQVPGSAPAGVAPKKIVPISVFVSRKLSKLFVRQDFKPLFDAVVKIQNPEEPLGTHVFTAMEFQNEGAAIRWTVVSMPEEFLRIKSSTKERGAPVKQIIETTLPAPLADKANTALDRIEIPRDVAERISELLTPASSVIISDHGISRETGNGTDFIVETQ